MTAVDPSQLESDQDQLLTSTLIANLLLTPQERIEAHENARQLAEVLMSAGKAPRAESL